MVLLCRMVILVILVSMLALMWRPVSVELWVISSLLREVLEFPINIDVEDCRTVLFAREILWEPPTTTMPPSVVELSEFCHTKIDEALLTMMPNPAEVMISFLLIFTSLMVILGWSP